jgi:hypothetical protein
LFIDRFTYSELTNILAAEKAAIATEISLLALK